MRIGRLDRIVQNNVQFSQNKNIEEQKLYVLQDISETLAMIYDKIAKNEAVEIDEENAVVVPPDALRQYKELFIDFPKMDEPYLVAIGEYIYGENGIDQLVNIIAFGEKMAMKLSDYNKDWRCWSKRPTKEQMDKEAWNK